MEQPTPAVLAPLARSCTRGPHQKQGNSSAFSVPERNWVAKVYFSPSVQATMSSGNHDFLAQGVEDIFHLYRFEWGGPRPAESVEAFKKRLRNARGDRKKQITRFPEESTADVEKRMSGARSQIYSIVNKLRHRLRNENDAPIVLPVPELKPVRAERGQGPLDILLKSTMGQDIPTPLTASGHSNPGARRQLGRDILNSLTPEIREELDDAVALAKEERAQTETEQAGGLDEYTRARIIPSLQPYIENVTRYVRDTANWVVSSVAGGPGADGRLRIIPVSMVKDRHGRDFWDAFCMQFNVDPDEFKLWCVTWHQQVINCPTLDSCTHDASSVPDTATSSVNQCLSALSLSTDIDDHVNVMLTGEARSYVSVPGPIAPPLARQPEEAPVVTNDTHATQDFPSASEQYVLTDALAVSLPVHDATPQICTEPAVGLDISEVSHLEQPERPASPLSHVSSAFNPAHNEHVSVYIDPLDRSDMASCDVTRAQDPVLDDALLEATITSPNDATPYTGSVETQRDPNDDLLFLSTPAHRTSSLIDVVSSMPTCPLASAEHEWVFATTNEPPQFQPPTASVLVDPLMESLNTAPVHSPPVAGGLVNTHGHDLLAAGPVDVVMLDQMSTLNELDILQDIPAVDDEYEGDVEMHDAGLDFEGHAPAPIHPGMDGLTATGGTVVIPTDVAPRKRSRHPSNKYSHNPGTLPLTSTVDVEHYDYGIRAAAKRRRRQTATKNKGKCPASKRGD